MLPVVPSKGRTPVVAAILDQGPQPPATAATTSPAGTPPAPPHIAAPHPPRLCHTSPPAATLPDQIPASPATASVHMLRAVLLEKTTSSRRRRRVVPPEKTSSYRRRRLDVPPEKTTSSHRRRRAVPQEKTTSSRRRRRAVPPEKTTSSRLPTSVDLCHLGSSHLAGNRYRRRRLRGDAPVARRWARTDGCWRKAAAMWWSDCWTVLISYSSRLSLNSGVRLIGDLRAAETATARPSKLRLERWDLGSCGDWRAANLQGEAAVSTVERRVTSGKGQRDLRSFDSSGGTSARINDRRDANQRPRDSPQGPTFLLALHADTGGACHHLRHIRHPAPLSAGAIVDQHQPLLQPPLRPPAPPKQVVDAAHHLHQNHPVPGPNAAEPHRAVQPDLRRQRRAPYPAPLPKAAAPPRRAELPERQLHRVTRQDVDVAAGGAGRHHATATGDRPAPQPRTRLHVVQVHRAGVYVGAVRPGGA
ncbi:Titin [Striga asiatica]|uniref:Titin n=1 Tax=Striga asiatica TaxID=4170 RepID=A0A5A7RCH8_STRAF|nr:Titin [Striga asiatica]